MLRDIGLTNYGEKLVSMYKKYSTNTREKDGQPRKILLEMHQDDTEMKPRSRMTFTKVDGLLY